MPSPYEDARVTALRGRFREAFGGPELPVPVEAIAENMLGLAVDEAAPEVAGQLGHSKGSTTLKHYAHLTEEARDGDRITLADEVEKARLDATRVRDSCVMPAHRHLRLVS